MTTSPPHFRAFAADLSYPEGILIGRLVPYNVPTKVLDWLPDGEPDIYDEGFRPGAFARQLPSVDGTRTARINLVHAHEGGLGHLGTSRLLREAPDGLYGEIVVLRSRRDDVADLLAVGIDELSIEFRERLTPRGASTTVVDADGVRWRTDVHLDRVALEPQGAYSGARVLAYRAELDTIEAEEAQRREAEAAERQAAADAEQAAAAEAEAAAAAETERARARAELDEWLAAEGERQRQLDERFASH
jgi:hypothetical protein